MNTVREQLVFDLSTGDLCPDPDHESGADRVGALARADVLGRALWRLTSTMAAHDFIEARRRLADRMCLNYLVKTHADYLVLIRVAHLALGKYLAGRRGKELIEASGVETAPIAKLLVAASALLKAADARVTREVDFQLGHRPRKRRT